MKFRTTSHANAALVLGAAMFLAAVSGSQAATILNATSQDRIVGEFEVSGTPVYNVNSASLAAGIGGAAGSRFNSNVVIGFTLPTLLSGQSIGSATFQIGATGSGSMSVSLFGLSTTNPDVTVATLFHEGTTGLGGGVDQLINASFSTVTAGVVNTATPSTSVTSFIQSFYSGGLVPSQSEVFLRLNPSTNLTPTVQNRVLYTVGTATLSLDIVPEPSALGLVSLGGLCLAFKRRR